MEYKIGCWEIGCIESAGSPGDNTLAVLDTGETLSFQELWVWD
jgi:hypothetical protein